MNFLYDGKMENEVGFNSIVLSQGSVFCQLQTLITTLLCMGGIWVCKLEFKSQHMHSISQWLHWFT